MKEIKSLFDVLLDSWVADDSYSDVVFKAKANSGVSIAEDEVEQFMTIFDLAADKMKILGLV